MVDSVGWLSLRLARGEVEKWLSVLEQYMVMTLRRLANVAVKDYEVPALLAVLYQRLGPCLFERVIHGPVGFCRLPRCPTGFVSQPTLPGQSAPHPSPLSRRESSGRTGSSSTHASWF